MPEEIAAEGGRQGDFPFDTFPGAEQGDPDVPGGMGYRALNACQVAEMRLDPDRVKTWRGRLDAADGREEFIVG
jgi:hypothetical protein